MNSISQPTSPTDVCEGVPELFEFFSVLRNLQTDVEEEKLKEFVRVLDGVIGSRKYDDRWASVWLLGWLAIVIHKRFPNDSDGSNVKRVVRALSAALADLDNGIVGSIVAPVVRSHRPPDKLSIAVLKAGCLIVIEHLEASGISPADAERQILTRDGPMVLAFDAFGRKVTKKNLATWKREQRKPNSFLRKIYADQKEIFDRYAVMAGTMEAAILLYVKHLLTYASSQVGANPPLLTPDHIGKG